jgi:hypothetical protein
LSFVFFGEKTTTAPTQPPTTVVFKTRMIPVQVGLKFFALQTKVGDGLFIEGGAGLNVITGKITVGGMDATPDDESHFSYAVGLGYRFNRFELAYKQQFTAAEYAIGSAASVFIPIAYSA